MDWVDTIAPWDQIRYFQTLKETTFTSLAAAVSVALADPQRVGLIFSVVGDYAVNISTKRSVSVTSGLVLLPDAPPFLLLHGQVGPLVQLEWFAIGQSDSGILTVIEIPLAMWPSVSPR